jgi:putative peptidoglycan lipid II flippase
VTEATVTPAEPPTGARPGAGLARTAARIAVVVAAARVVGFVRVFVQANTIGPGVVGDTYAGANQLPNIVFDVVAGGALSSAVVPVLGGPVERGDRQHAARTVSALLTWTVVVLVPVAVLGSLLGRPLMALLVSGVDDPVLRAEKTELGARMLVVFMPQVVLYGVGIILTGVLQAHRRFVAPALAPLLSSMVVIAAYLLYAAQGGATSIGRLSQAEELTLSVGTTLGVAALSLPLLVPVARLQLGLRPTLRMPPGVAQQLRRLALSGGVALAAQQIAAGVVIVLAQPVVGAQVVYQLAWTVFLVPWAVLAVPIATSAFPALAAAADGADEQRYRATHAAALRGLLVVCLLAAALLGATARPVARLLLALAPAEIGGDQTAELARAVAAFAPGLVAYGALALLTRALYARHDGRSPAVATAAGFAIAIAVDIALAATLPDDWRIAGVGLGNTVGMTVAALLLVRAVGRTAGSAALAGIGRTLAAGVTAAVLAAVAGAVVAAVVGGEGIPLALGSAAAAAVVATGCFALVTMALLGVDPRAYVTGRPWTAAPPGD